MNHALSVLEFASVQSRLAFHCETVLGAALAGKLSPKFDCDSVWRELGRTTEAFNFLSEVPAPSWGPSKTYGIRSNEPQGEGL